jgi:threonine dehydrogenase-like Zn-dependent dehydrogenase
MHTGSGRFAPAAERSRPGGIEVRMKAIAVFPSAKEVRLIDQAAPEIESATHVKVRILEVGVCGTDREICAFEYGTPPSGSSHLVIGHECLGEVVEVGSAVTRVRVGDLVVPMVRRPCVHTTCVACTADRQDFCYTGEFAERGIKERHGFMTELVVDDEQYMNTVPRTLRDVAVLVEPLTIAEKALEQIWQVQQRLPWGCPIDGGAAPGRCHKAVVLGAGPVGLLGAMALVLNGFDTWVYSREQVPNPKSTLVEAIDAHYVSAADHSIEDLARLVGGIDVVYEATGASSIAFQMMQALGTNAIFVFTGVPGRKAPIELDADLLMRNLVLKNQLVFGTVNAGRQAFENSIRDLDAFRERWPEAVASLITSRNAPGAYRELLQGPLGGIKNVISFDAAA